MDLDFDSRIHKNLMQVGVKLTVNTRPVRKSIRHLKALCKRSPEAMRYMNDQLANGLTMNDLVSTCRSRKFLEFCLKPSARFRTIIAHARLLTEKGA